MIVHFFNYIHKLNRSTLSYYIIMSKTFQELITHNH